MKGIYFIKNKENEKGYVGSSSDIEKRWKEHKRRLIAGTHWNQHLQHAWNLYKEDSFEFLVLEEVSNDLDLIPREQYFIDLYGTYNFQPAGKFGEFPQHGEFNHMYGKTHDEEWKKKQSENMMGDKNHFYGKTHSEETKRLIKEKRKEQRFSDETKKQLSESIKQACSSPERREQLSLAAVKGNRSLKRLTHPVEEIQEAKRRLEAGARRVDVEREFNMGKKLVGSIKKGKHWVLKEYSW